MIPQLVPRGTTTNAPTTPKANTVVPIKNASRRSGGIDCAVATTPVGGCGHLLQQGSSVVHDVDESEAPVRTAERFEFCGRAGIAL